MLTFHGTALDLARDLASKPQTVDLTRGGGELGQGFYVGDSVALAAAWAQGRFADPGVLQIELQDAEYVRLSILTLKQEEVRRQWQEFKRLRTTRTHRFGYDVVYAPFATYPAWQHKFETSKSGHVLTRASWVIL